MEPLFKKWDKCLLVIALVIYVTVFTRLSFIKHDHFFTGFRDLGIYDKIIYNTSQGSFFLSSLDLIRQSKNNALGLHAEFILLPFALIYRVFAEPKILLFSQSKKLGVLTILLGLGWFLVVMKVFINYYSQEGISLHFLTTQN